VADELVDLLATVIAPAAGDRRRLLTSRSRRDVLHRCLGWTRELLISIVTHLRADVAKRVRAREFSINYYRAVGP
jgi:hypothetical protein